MVAIRKNVVPAQLVCGGTIQIISSDPRCESVVLGKNQLTVSQEMNDEESGQDLFRYRHGIVFETGLVYERVVHYVLLLQIARQQRYRRPK